MNEFYVMRVNHRTFDVFQGKQWGAWSRLRSGHSGVYVANGEKLSHAVTKQLATSIDPKQQQQFITL